MKLLSISIAAYNVENYIEQTLSSLCDSRILDDVEVLIIDDGSKDNTDKIAMKYANDYPETFIYVKKENGGHGSTINKGVEMATGKYFRVIDGDDWVDTEEFVLYIEQLKATDTDMVLNSFYKVTQGGQKLLQFEKLEDGKMYSLSDSAIKAQVQEQIISLHTLTVRTKLLQENHVKITEKCFYVDVEYIAWAIYYSDSVCYIDAPLYMYRMGNENQSVNKKNMLKNVEMQRKVSLKLAAMYDQFLKDDNLDENKLQVIFLRVRQSIGSTIRTYMLMDDAKIVKKKITAFDREINDISDGLYRALNRSLFFKAIRLGNYCIIPIVRRGYLIWVRRYMR